MSGWTLFWIVLVLLIVFVVLANLRDIKRYIKIRLM
jgi:biopolymer transport protein ExbD